MFIMSSEIESSSSFRKELIKWRRTIHQSPELSNEEEKTSKYVQEYLTSLDIPFKLSYNNGIVAEVKGKRPGPAVGLRADMDALPLQEKNDVEYRSKNDGVMHACGHDAHTAMLMGAARLLKENNDFSGTVVLAFQPAEEKAPGGAKPMIEEGSFDEYDLKAFFALHVIHEFDAGVVVMKPGFLTAGSDAVFIDIEGRGTHAAEPHLGDDVVFAAAQFITACQQIRARQIDSFEPFVLSLTSVHGGTAPNIMSDSIRISGTTRSSTRKTREWLDGRLKEIAEGVSKSTGCKVTANFRYGYSPGYNDEELSKLVEEAAENIPGLTECISDYIGSMGGEDFFEFSFDEKVPVAMALLGIRNEEKGFIYPVHNPRFDIEESALSVGADLLARTAKKVLSKY